MKQSQLSTIGIVFICCGAIVFSVWQADDGKLKAQFVSQADSVVQEDESGASTEGEEGLLELATGAADSLTSLEQSGEADEAGDDVAAPENVAGEEPVDPMDRLEALNLKGVEIRALLPKLSNWTGKIFIDASNEEAALKQKISIVSERRLPRRDALKTIYAALKAKGFIVEEEDGLLYLKEADKAKVKKIPTLLADEPLALLEDKTQLVQKFFDVHIFSPTKLRDYVQPLLGDNGHITADDSRRKLVVIESVDNLMRIEKIIQQLDVPEAELSATEIIKVIRGDAVQIVQVLRILLEGQAVGLTGSVRDRDRGRDRGRRPPERSSLSTPSVSIGLSSNPILLTAWPKENWIIARATPDDMFIIKEEIRKLDLSEPVEPEYETLPVKFADVNELANQLDRALQQLPGSEMKSSVMVRALPKARQIMIFGSQEKRNVVKKFIQEIDVPPGRYERRTFKLKHADPETIKENIEALYSAVAAGDPYSRYQPAFLFGRGRGGGSRGSESAADEVRVIAFETLKQVTVIASPEKMIKVTKSIEEWDQPLDVDDFKPLIVTLKNTDAVQMSNLLSELFSENGSSTLSYFSTPNAFGTQQEQQTIVGPLFGKLTFKPVPDKKKIVVISKIASAYPVIEELIMDLDRQESAELPMVVTLQYADPEELCDQLNALLNEPGTPATVYRQKRGLSQDQTDESGERQAGSGQQEEQRNNSNAITLWWTQARQQLNEMPTSNLVGKIRFVPVARSKAIMVLTPPEHQESLRKMIAELDQPGKQVMIRAVIVEVSHDSATSLGVQLASDPLALGAANENSVSALTNLLYAEQTGAAFAIDSTVSVTALLDLLIKKAHARILNQPTLWTKDNEEAVFFKGKGVPFVVSSQTSTEGTAQRDSVTYNDVGLDLRVRPNITPENKVDITIFLEISQVDPDQINGNIVTNTFNTTTHLIVEDGQTIMISGILFQNDSQIERKIPLLGDLPLLGSLFRHYDTATNNTELLAFITPYVLDTSRDQNEAMNLLQEETEKMRNIRKRLDKTVTYDEDE